MCKISPSTVVRIAKEDDLKTRTSRMKHTRGRPRKITPRMERYLVRCLKELRMTGGAFTSKKIAIEAGVPDSISNRTLRRALNRRNYFFLQRRKKGLVTLSDCEKRLKFANQRLVKEESFWKETIAFYFDGVSFIHKTRPLDQALAPPGRVWRKRCEGLDTGCTAKASSSLAGGKKVKVFVAISYGKGVILAKPYEQLDGRMFADFVTEHFPETFLRSGKDTSTFLQDGDPSQNSALVREVLHDMGVNCFRIPPRSPDLNPIENLFHLVKMQLSRDALEKTIGFENFASFQERVLETLLNFNAVKIDNIIDSMVIRIRNVRERRGQRIKY